MPTNNRNLPRKGIKFQIPLNWTIFSIILITFCTTKLTIYKPRVYVLNLLFDMPSLIALNLFAISFYSFGFRFWQRQSQVCANLSSPLTAGVGFAWSLFFVFFMRFKTYMQFKIKMLVKAYMQFKNKILFTRCFFFSFALQSEETLLTYLIEHIVFFRFLALIFLIFVFVSEMLNIFKIKFIKKLRLLFHHSAKIVELWRQVLFLWPVVFFQKIYPFIVFQKKKTLWQRRGFRRHRATYFFQAVSFYTNFIFLGFVTRLATYLLFLVDIPVKALVKLLVTARSQWFWFYYLRYGPAHFLRGAFFDFCLDLFYYFYPVETHHHLPEAHEHRLSDNIALLQRKDKLVKSFIIDVQTGLISARSLEKNIRLISSLGLTEAQSRKIRSAVEQASIYSATPHAMRRRRGHLLPSRLFTLRRQYAIFLELFKSWWPSLSLSPVGARKLNVYFPPLPLSWSQVNFLQFVLPVLQLYFFFTLRGLVFLVFVVLPLRPVWSIFFYFDTRYVNKLSQTENFYFSFFPFFKAFPPKGDRFAHAFSFFAGSVKRWLEWHFFFSSTKPDSEFDFWSLTSAVDFEPSKTRADLEDDVAEDFVTLLDEATRIDDWSEIDTEHEEDEEAENALDQDPNISGPSDDERAESSSGGLRSAGDRSDHGRLWSDWVTYGKKYPEDDFVAAFAWFSLLLLTGSLLVIDNRDVFQQFSDFIMSSYMAFMAFMADIQIPVLMGNSEWHWPSGWDSPGTAASWGSLDVVGWQTWSLNTDLELRLYDIQQFREVFVFKHKDAVYYPLFDSGVLKLKKFENIYSFDPSFDISKSQFFLNYFFDLSFFTSENTTRLFHKTWALSSAPSNWYPRSIKDLPPVLNMDGLSAPVSNFLKALYGGGAGSAASENVVAAPEPAKPELTPEQMRAWARASLPPPPMLVRNDPYANMSPRDFLYLVDRNIRLFYPEPALLKTSGHVPSREFLDSLTVRWKWQRMPGKYQFVSPIPSVLPDALASKPMQIDLTQYFIFKQCYDFYVTISNLYQEVSDYFSSQKPSEKSRELEALGPLVNKKPNFLPLTLSDNRTIQLRDDNGLVVTTIKLTSLGDCYNFTTKAPCTPAEFASVRYKPIINSALEDSEAAGLPVDKTAVKSIKAGPLVSGADPGWIDRELSRRENTRPPHVIWERYLAKREKKTGPMRKFTAMTAGMYNVWPGSYLSYHRVSKGLFETAYFWPSGKTKISFKYYLDNKSFLKNYEELVASDVYPEELWYVDPVKKRGYKHWKKISKSERYTLADWWWPMLPTVRDPRWIPISDQELAEWKTWDAPMVKPDRSKKYADFSSRVLVSDPYLVQNFTWKTVEADEFLLKGMNWREYESIYVHEWSQENHFWNYDVLWQNQAFSTLSQNRYPVQAADYFSEMPKQVELFSEEVPVRITYPVPVSSVSVFSSSGDGELYLRNALNFSPFRRDRCSLLSRFYADSNFSIANQPKSNPYDEYTHFLAPLNPTLSTTIKGVCPESILLWQSYKMLPPSLRFDSYDVDTLWPWLVPDNKTQGWRLENIWNRAWDVNLHWYWDGALYEGDSGLVQKSYGGDLWLVNLPVWFKNYDSEGNSLVYVPEYLISRRAKDYAVQWENPLIWNPMTEANASDYWGYVKGFYKQFGGSARAAYAARQRNGTLRMLELAYFDTEGWGDPYWEPRNFVQILAASAVLRKHMEGFNLVINGDEAPANTLHWIGFDANAYFKLFVWDNFPTRAEKWQLGGSKDYTPAYTYWRNFFLLDTILPRVYLKGFPNWHVDSENDSIWNAPSLEPVSFPLDIFSRWSDACADYFWSGYLREDDDEGEETEEDTHGAFEQIVSAEGVEQEEDLELDWFGSHAVSNVLALDRDETRLRPSNEEDEQSSFTITDVSPGSYTMEKSGFGAKVRRIPSELDLVLLRYPTAVPYEYLVQNKFLYSLLAGHDFMVNRSWNGKYWEAPSDVSWDFLDLQSVEIQRFVDGYAWRSGVTETFGLYNEWPEDEGEETEILPDMEFSPDVKLWWANNANARDNFTSFFGPDYWADLSSLSSWNQHLFADYSSPSFNYIRPQAELLPSFNGWSFEVQSVELDAFWRNSGCASIAAPRRVAHWDEELYLTKWRDALPAGFTSPYRYPVPDRSFYFSPDSVEGIDNAQELFPDYVLNWHDRGWWDYIHWGLWFWIPERALLDENLKPQMDTVFWSYNGDLHSRQEQSSSHSFFFTFSPQPRVNPGLLDLTPAELSRAILPDWRATIPRSLFKSLNPLYAHLEQADVYTRREAGRLARLWKNSQLWFWNPWAKNSFSNVVLEPYCLEISFHDYYRQAWPYYDKLLEWKLSVDETYGPMPAALKYRLWMINGEPRGPVEPIVPFSVFSMLKAIFGFR